MSKESDEYFLRWIEKAEEDRLVVQQLVDADSSARGAIGRNLSHEPYRLWR